MDLLLRADAAHKNRINKLYDTLVTDARAPVCTTAINNNSSEL